MISAPLDAREVKARCDFHGLIVSRYQALARRLRKRGRQYVATCPFHKESNPSFYIELERKVFYCHGCGAGGDVFAFTMRIEKCDFPLALQIIAEFNDLCSGIALGSGPRSGPRLAGSERGEAPSAREAGGSASQNERAQILARLDATDRRLRAIEATNRAASAALATACEPRSGEPLLVTNRITVHE